MVENDSEGPYIAGNAVVVVFEGFGRHVDRTADVVIFMLPELIDGHCKAKISKFIHSLQMKHVRRFYISVDEASLMDFCVSFDELSHDFDGFVVGQGFSLSKDVVEIPFAQFRNDVGVIFGGVDVVEVQHVFGLTQLFQGGDLELE